MIGRDAGQIVIVYMGDSITFGQYVEPRFRWTTLVDAKLNEKLGPAGLTFITYNRGVSGETTRMGLERFPRDVQQLRPDLVTLQYGLNDCNCWETDKGLPRVSPDVFRANLGEMVTRARHFGAEQVILSTNHRTLRRSVLPSGETYENANRRYSEIVRHVAYDTGSRLCDVARAFVPFSDEELNDLLLPTPDVLHLSERGNRVYAELIWPEIYQGVAAVLDTKRIATTT